MPAKAKATTRSTTSGKSATKSKASPKAGTKLAQIKTKPTAESVDAFLNKVADQQQRRDSFVILDMMKAASGEEPKMWGTSLIGFGNVRLKSPKTGREVDWLRIGFSPRKANLSLYITGDINKHGAALKKLGKHTTGVGCLYIKTLDDVDLKVLKGMMEVSLREEFFGTGN